MFLQYPSTDQFRHIITSVKKASSNQKLPVLKFLGTLKLHGSNAAIGYQKESGHWFQSRNKIIIPGEDFKGFAMSMDPVADELLTECILLSPAIREQYEQGRKIVIFGEWCGGTIQKNIAIYGLPKMFVIFKVQVCDESAITEEFPVETDENEQQIATSKFWLHPKDWSNIKWHEKCIYNIYDFQTYEIDIDFGSPEISQNKLIEITEAVQDQCPVGTYFNRTGVGEGVVWTEWEKSSGDFTFKVKGEKHSVSQIATLASVDTEKFINIQNFIDYACTENRMLQGIDYLHEQQLTIEMKNIGTFIRWIVGDIVKEEKDTMEASDINSKDVGRMARNRVLPWFQMQIASLK